MNRLTEAVNLLKEIAGQEELDALNKRAKQLQEQWDKLRTMVEERISVGNTYLNFHKMAAQVGCDTVIGAGNVTCCVSTLVI